MNISISKSKHNLFHVTDHVERLKQLQTIYDIDINLYGDVSKCTIKFGMNLAISLWHTKCRIKAKILMTKLASTSKQVLGPEHNTTKLVEPILQNMDFVFHSLIGIMVLLITLDFFMLEWNGTHHLRFLHVGVVLLLKEKKY